jgi:hypothetical protein
MAVCSGAASDADLMHADISGFADNGAMSPLQ